MNIHVINRSETWPTAQPFVAADDLVIWTDTAGIGNLSAELKLAGMKIICLTSDEGISDENQDFPIISDEAWVQFVLNSTTLFSWG